jgi:hypothetical protein
MSHFCLLCVYQPAHWHVSCVMSSLERFSLIYTQPPLHKMWRIIETEKIYLRNILQKMTVDNMYLKCF